MRCNITIDLDYTCNRVFIIWLSNLKQNTSTNLTHSYYCGPRNKRPTKCPLMPSSAQIRCAEMLMFIHCSSCVVRKRWVSQKTLSSSRCLSWDRWCRLTGPQGYPKSDLSTAGFDRVMWTCWRKDSQPLLIHLLIEDVFNESRVWIYVQWLGLLMPL